MDYIDPTIDTVAFVTGIAQGVAGCVLTKLVTARIVSTYSESLSPEKRARLQAVIGSVGYRAFCKQVTDAARNARRAVVYVARRAASRAKKIDSLRSTIPPYLLPGCPAFSSDLSSHLLDCVLLWCPDKLPLLAQTTVELGALTQNLRDIKPQIIDGKASRKYIRTNLIYGRSSDALIHLQSIFDFKNEGRKTVVSEFHADNGTHTSGDTDPSFVPPEDKISLEVRFVNGQITSVDVVTRGPKRVCIPDAIGALVFAGPHTLLSLKGVPLHGLPLQLRDVRGFPRLVIKGCHLGSIPYMVLAAFSSIDAANNNISEVDLPIGCNFGSVRLEGNPPGLQFRQNGCIIEYDLFLPLGNHAVNRRAVGCILKIGEEHVGKDA